MKNILFIAFSSFIFLFVSCTSEQETETYIPIDEIIPLDTHLIPNKDTKIVSTTLNFKDIDAIDYLLVRKSVGDSYSAKISQSELTSDYISIIPSKNRSTEISASISCLLQRW